MWVKKFPDFKTALEKEKLLDTNHLTFWHKLEAGKGFEAFVGEVDEWFIFFNGGEFTMTIGGPEVGGKTNYMDNLKKSQVTVVFIPRGEIHALKAHSDLFYCVVEG